MAIFKKILSFSAGTIGAAIFTFNIIGCNESKPIGPIEEDNYSIALDDFKIALNQENYSNQNKLGALVGAKIDADSISKGGGFWYPVASGNGAKIMAFDEQGAVVEILDSAETGDNESDASNEDMEQLFWR